MTGVASFIESSFILRVVEHDATVTSLDAATHAGVPATVAELVQRVTTTYGADVVVTRCTNNYGPYQFPEKVIPLFVTKLLEGQKVQVYGGGGTKRDWLFVAPAKRGEPLS